MEDNREEIYTYEPEASEDEQQDTVQTEEQDAVETTDVMQPEEPEAEETADASETEAPEAVQTAEISQPEQRRKSRGWLKFIGGFALGFAACVGVLAVMLYAADLGRIIPTDDYKYYDDLNTKYGKYYMIMELIGKDPLVDVDPHDLTEESIKEMIDNLDDPYASYFTRDEYEAFRRTFEGNYSGLGILVEQTEDALVINEVFEDGPAEKGGMKPGDRILRVDGVTPENIDDAVRRMTGEEGTKVTVTVDRDGEELDFTMTREPIEVDSVAHFVTPQDPEVGYIVVALFAEDTAEEFEEAVDALKEEGCDKFIIDLRDNGGGLTDSSIRIADYLLPECTIMTEKTKDGTEKVYTSEASSADLDMVVLVNENTASSSEILTGALQDNDACTVLGSRTFGKGVTQVTHQFKDGSAVKITVTEYLTPDGHHVQDNGITPDIEVSADEIMERAIEEVKK